MLFKKGVLGFCCSFFLVSVALAQPQDIQAPVFLEKITPSYPERGLQANLQGTVLLMADLKAEGKMGNVAVLRGLGSGQYGFEEAAIEAVEQWRFIPGKIDGKPSTVRMTLMIDFTLHPGAKETLISWNQKGRGLKKVYPPTVTRLTPRADPGQVNTVPITIRLNASGAISKFWGKGLRRREIRAQVENELKNYHFQAAVGDGHTIPCTLTFNLALPLK